MTAPRKIASRLLACLAVASTTLAFLGCGDDGLDKRYPVSGTVTYKGAPLEKGTVTFLPDDAAKGRGAVGEIKNGSFSMTTQSPGDGAFPGTYSVTITDQVVDMASADAATKKKAEKAKVANPSAMPDQAAVAKAYSTAKNLVPAKYAQIATSGLKAEIKASSNTLKYELVD